MVSSRDGTAIGWHEAGEGPPAVLVHGAAADKTTWIGCAPHWSSRLTLYAVDRRGRGRSADAAEYAIEREYEDIAAVVDAVGGAVTLIGHSYGALVALGAARLADAVARLVLYEPPLLTQQFYDCEEWATRIDESLAARDLSKAASDFLERPASAEEIALLRAYPPAWERVERNIDTVSRELRSLVGMPSASFDDVSVPTLVLAGERSVPYLRASAEHVARMLPAGRAGDIAGQGHLALAFAPQLFCDEVLSFVADPLAAG